MSALTNLFPFKSPLASSRSLQGRSRLASIFDDLAIEIDHNDSPVSKQPAEWLVCFVPGLKKQWWHRFTHPKHKHVFAIKMVGDDQWVLVEPWWTRIMVTTLRTDEAVKFLRWGAAGSILRVTERIPGRGSQARGWANCAVLISLMLGRSYWTWTPHGLYKRLSAEDGVEQVELDGFLEEKLTSSMRAMSEKALSDVPTLIRLSPEAALMELGRRISKVVFASSSLSFYRLAVSEAPRFPAAAGAYFHHGPHQALDIAKALISHFRASGQFRECDEERASRAFLSMLLGNLFQQIALGCRTEPDERDLEARTRAVVSFFLRGLRGSAELVETHKIEELIESSQPGVESREQITRAEIRLPAQLPAQKHSTRHWKQVGQNAIRPFRHEVKTA